MSLLLSVSSSSQLTVASSVEVALTHIHSFSSPVFSVILLLHRSWHYYTYSERAIGECRSVNCSHRTRFHAQFVRYRLFCLFCLSVSHPDAQLTPFVTGKDAQASDVPALSKLEQMAYCVIFFRSKKEWRRFGLKPSIATHLIILTKFYAKI